MYCEHPFNLSSVTGIEKSKNHKIILQTKSSRKIPVAVQAARNVPTLNSSFFKLPVVFLAKGLMISVKTTKKHVLLA